MELKDEDPQVTHVGFFDMQVCVPASFDDEQVVKFLERNHPCGTSNGWVIRKQGNERLGGCAERVPCIEREGYVHIMLEA